MTYGFSHGYSIRSGFPHSDIGGSKLVCQLPEAFRRLPRPSSPVIAKASTTCTCSLDPIALMALHRSLDSKPMAIGGRGIELIARPRRNLKPSVYPARSQANM